MPAPAIPTSTAVTTHRAGRGLCPGRPGPRRRLVVSAWPGRCSHQARAARGLPAPADQRDALGGPRLLRRPRRRRGLRQRRLPARVRSRPRVRDRDARRQRADQHSDAHPGTGLRGRELHHPRGGEKPPGPRGALRSAPGRRRHRRERVLRPRRPRARVSGQVYVRVLRPGARRGRGGPGGGRRGDLCRLLDAQHQRLRREPGGPVGVGERAVRHRSRRARPRAAPRHGVQRALGAAGRRPRGRRRRRAHRLLRLVPVQRGRTERAVGARHPRRRARSRRGERLALRIRSLVHGDRLPRPPELHRGARELADRPVAVRPGGSLRADQPRERGRAHRRASTPRPRPWAASATLALEPGVFVRLGHTDQTKSLLDPNNSLQAWDRRIDAGLDTLDAGAYLDLDLRLFKRLHVSAAVRAPICSSSGSTTT